MISWIHCLRTAWVALAILTTGTFAHAWPYSPLTPCPFQFDDAGVIPLNFEAQFQPWRAKISNAISNKDSDDKAALLHRARRLEERKAHHSPEERSTYVSDLYYLNEKAKLSAILLPRRSDPRALMTLSHLLARNGEWEDAIRNYENAIDSREEPEASPGVSLPQARWLMSVDPYYLRWLKHKRIERSLDRATLDVPPIFQSPVRFVNEQGEYEPGQLAAAERAKLPPDAVAIVQQLILWHPEDNGLMWLLAELYAAEGKFQEAFLLIDVCTQNGYTFPRVVEHRLAILKAYERMPKPKEEALLLGNGGDTPPEPRAGGLFDVVSPLKFTVAVSLFALFTVLVMVMQVRAFRKRRRLKSGNSPSI